MTDQQPHTPTYEHVTYYAAGVTRTFCAKCTWSVATEHRSLNMQAFDKHVCKEAK